MAEIIPLPQMKIIKRVTDSTFRLADYFENLLNAGLDAAAMHETATAQAFAVMSHVSDNDPRELLERYRERLNEIMLAENPDPSALDFLAVGTAGLFLALVGVYSLASSEEEGGG